MPGFNDYREAIDNQVTQSILDGFAEKDKAIGKAMRRHSRNFPRKLVEDVAGDGGFRYDLSSELASWEENFSQVLVVEYPVDDAEQAKNVLDQEAWTVRDNPTNGRELHMLEDQPPATEAMRLTYTARHTCTVSACTVPDSEAEAVEALAASYFCRILAARTAENQDSTIAADVVDHSSKSRDYNGLAKQFEAEYHAMMGIDPNKPVPAGVIVDWDVNIQGGADRLTHPRRKR